MAYRSYYGGFHYGAPRRYGFAGRGFGGGFGRGRWGRPGGWGRRFGEGRRWSWMGGGGGGEGGSPLLPWAQACLAQLLGPQVVQDGVMGPNTRQAIQQFQTQGQLPVTGVLDATTVSALQAACSGQQAGAGQDAGPPPPPQAGEQGESERGHGRRWGRGRR